MGGAQFRISLQVSTGLFSPTNPPTPMSYPNSSSLSCSGTVLHCFQGPSNIFARTAHSLPTVTQTVTLKSVPYIQK